jgi:hypothetical protein
MSAKIETGTLGRIPYRLRHDGAHVPTTALCPSSFLP